MPLHQLIAEDQTCATRCYRFRIEKLLKLLGNQHERDPIMLALDASS
jgi:hypothetical protein